MSPYSNANLPTSQLQNIGCHTFPNATASLESNFTNVNAAVLPKNEVSNIKLYPLSNFAGNAEEWQLFIANHRDTIAEFRYSNRQNLMRLYKALQDEARFAVTSLLIFPENVPLVIEEVFASSCDNFR